MFNFSSLEPQVIQVNVPRSAYIHIPFCRRRCYYCDFPISVLGNSAKGETSRSVEKYIESLCEEIIVNPVLGNPLNTVFFGGGTPSLLSVGQLERILDTLNQRFGIVAEAEISMEIDPGTFDLKQIQGYRTAGVNRVSLGVQAFQTQLLQVCGRSHQVTDIFAAVELIRQVGFPEFSIDLISGLPHQTLQQWQESLNAVVAIAPTHISVYDLTIEPRTAFSRQYQPGDKPLPSDDTTVQMYKLAQQILTDAGYQHYEISNYAQPGHQCRHNRVYWENRPYYGFGMGAASYWQGKRFTRPRTRQEYFQWVQQFQAAGGVIDSPPLSATDIFLETLMLGLRLAEGVNLKTLADQFGERILAPMGTCLQPYHQEGWVEVVDLNTKAFTLHPTQPLPNQGWLRLTDPEGFLFSNTVLADLFNLNLNFL